MGGPFGAPHSAAVVERLSDVELRVKLAAAAGLAAMGEAGAAHADKLVPFLADPHMRHSAIAALTAMGSHEADVAALLVSPDWFVRRDALVGLQAVGPLAAAYAACVVALLADIHRDVRLGAVGVLAAMGVAGAAYIQELQQLASRPGEDIDVKQAAEAVIVKQTVS